MLSTLPGKTLAAACALMMVLTLCAIAAPHARAAAQIVEFAMPQAASGPASLTAGPDGALWLAEFDGARIARMAADGTFQEFNLPPGCQPVGIISGPDGALWFCELTLHRVVRMTTGGVITNEIQFPIGSGPCSITFGPDGYIWVTEYYASKIARCSPAGVVAEYPTPAAGANPREICVGPDGAVWFTEMSAQFIGRCTVAGVVTHYPTPGTATFGITMGPDGNPWFTELAGNSISTINASGTISRFPLPTPASAPYEITTGPDGALWCVGFDSNKVIRCTTAGAMTEYDIPTAASSPVCITSGPDSAIWFSERIGNKVGRLTGYPTDTWYLAEGSTAWGFSEYFTVENPNPTEVPVTVSYVTQSGPVPGHTFTMPPYSQIFVSPSDTVGFQDVSTIVRAAGGKTIAVDRTMAWSAAGINLPEGHSCVGVTRPATTWYLAEGSTAWGFECWLLIQNPTATDALCTVTYMIEGEGPREFSKMVPAGTRRTYDVSQDIGAKDASIKVVSNVPVIPERAMYRNQRREGHESIGTVAPSQDFFLAEGTTAWGFTTYVLVQNPNATPVDVTVTYMTPAGPRQEPAFPMPANSRKTIRVNDVVPNTDLSTHVHGTLPIIAERAMYWGAGTPSGESCHDSIGMSGPHTTFYLPDGTTSAGHETWTLVQNPNPVPVDVGVFYLREGGGLPAVVHRSIPGGSRETFNMAEAGVAGGASVLVNCETPGKKVMCERAIYWSNRSAGTDTIGAFSD